MTSSALQGGGPHRWWHPMVLWGPPLAGLAWVLMVEPGPGTTPPCPSMKLLHVPCPACGTLRSVHALGQGEWQQAFALQPLLAVALIMAVVYWPFRDRVAAWWSNRSARARYFVLLAVALCFLVWWSARIVLFWQGLAGPV